MTEKNVTNNAGLKTENGQFLNDLPGSRPFPRPAPCGGLVVAGGHSSSDWQGMSSISSDIGLTAPDFRRRLASMISAWLHQIFGDAVIMLIPKIANLLPVADTQTPKAG